MVKCFNLLAPDFQLVDFLFLSRYKGTFKRVPCDKTLFISKAERKYLSDSKVTAFSSDSQKRHIMACENPLKE